VQNPIGPSYIYAFFERADFAITENIGRYQQQNVYELTRWKLLNPLIIGNIDPETIKTDGAERGAGDD
jgi:hypothetical protein